MMGDIIEVVRRVNDTHADLVDELRRRKKYCTLLKICLGQFPLGISKDNNASLASLSMDINSPFLEWTWNKFQWSTGVIKLTARKLVEIEQLLDGL